MEKKQTRIVGYGYAQKEHMLNVFLQHAPV